MATTSLWHIKGNLKDLIDYIENPEKTTSVGKDLQSFLDVFNYVQRGDATNAGEYVTAINCVKEIALQQMIHTKKQYAKESGYVAWHGYQSFKPGELTEDECHKIGVALAEEMWGDKFQVIVTTHLDKAHLHNHFCINSVSFKDGSKYNYSKSERKRFMEISDRLCREHDLSVIERPHKAPSRPTWLDEKSGKPTRYNIYRADVLGAIRNCCSIGHMMVYLIRLGYDLDFSGAHWKIKLPQYKHYTRLDTLDDRLTPEYIVQNIGRPYSRSDRPSYVSHPSYIPPEYQVWRPYKKTIRIRTLYYYWCYELGILPKHTDYKPTSPFLREELRKIDEIDRQTVYMDRHNIHTLDDLYADIAKNRNEMNDLLEIRKSLQNDMRKASEDEKEQLREKSSSVSKKISELRKDIKLAGGIETRSARIDKALQEIYDSESIVLIEQQKNNRENTRSSELER